VDDDVGYVNFFDIDVCESLLRLVSLILPLLLLLLLLFVLLLDRERSEA